MTNKAFIKKIWDAETIIERLIKDVGNGDYYFEGGPSVITEANLQSLVDNAHRLHIAYKAYHEKKAV